MIAKCRANDAIPTMQELPRCYRIWFSHQSYWPLNFYLYHLLSSWSIIYFVVSIGYFTCMSISISVITHVISTHPLVITYWMSSSNKTHVATFVLYVFKVFPCVSATCGQFYHPECVSKLLHPDNESLAEEHRERIAAGESFTCPVHKCFVCQQSEDMNVEDLQLAICRRCPKAYHRKCLPRHVFVFTSYMCIQLFTKFHLQRI